MTNPSSSAVAELNRPDPWGGFWVQLHEMSKRLGELFLDGDASADASADALLERFLDYTAGKG